MSFTGLITLMLALHGAPPIASAPGALREVFPGVRADAAAKLVEFDGQITPMLVKDDRAPLFFLEVLACAPNTREHEAFVITTARPSHIHAALLLIGLTPGSPGSWKVADGKLEPIQPTGDRLAVTLAWTDKDGNEIEQDPLDWIVSTTSKFAFKDAERALAAKNNQPAPGWLFAGSKAGGERAAAIFSIIETCKLNGVEPFAYMSDTMQKIAEGWPNSRIDEIMPWAWNPLAQHKAA